MPDPVPFPPRPGIRPEPAPTPPPEPAEEQPLAASDDRYSLLVRLAAAQAHQSDVMRMLCIEGAADSIDAMAGSIAFSRVTTYTRQDVVSMLRVAAQNIRKLKSPTTASERCGGPI